MQPEEQIENSPDSTIHLHPGRDLPYLDTGLELLVVDPGNRESSWPICRSVMQMGKATGVPTNDIILEGPNFTERQALLQYQQGKVLFLNVNAAVAAFKGKAPVSFCELQLTDEIRLGDLRLRLVTRQEGPASLEGYSHPYRGRRWILGQEVCRLGRPGKRDNWVQLEDKTVSRTHASIDSQGDQFLLKPDTFSVPTFVNGHKLEGPRVLQDGDLIQLGVQILRFRLSKPKVDERNLQTKMATVLFADIWNYAALSDSRPLDELIRQVGDFYEMVEEVVSANRGLLNSYLGDSVVVIFGVAEHSDEDHVRAVRSALTIQAKMDKLNHTWRHSGLPPFRVGIGVHTGEIVLGDISLQGKAELAAVGGQVEVAAQVEKLTKQYDARVLISQTTARGLAPHFDLRSHGPVKLEGAKGPLEVFEVSERPGGT